MEEKINELIEKLKKSKEYNMRHIKAIAVRIDRIYGEKVMYNDCSGIMGDYFSDEYLFEHLSPSKISSLGRKYGALKKFWGFWENDCDMITELELLIKKEK